MRRNLRSRGFVALGGQDLSSLEQEASFAGLALGPGGTVDCIALLNVLDRCEAPRSLLAELRRRLRPGTGLLLLAVVLPFRPFVERGARRERPRERLPLPSDGSWEDSVT